MSAQRYTHLVVSDGVPKVGDVVDVYELGDPIPAPKSVFEISTALPALGEASTEEENDHGH